jgi:hypothetical protein
MKKFSVNSFIKQSLRIHIHHLVKLDKATHPNRINLIHWKKDTYYNLIDISID